MHQFKLLAIAATLGFAFSIPAAAQTSGAKSEATTPSAAQTTAPAQSASGGQTTSMERAPERDDRTNWGWLGLLGLAGLAGLRRRRDERPHYDATGTRKTVP